MTIDRQENILKRWLEWKGSAWIVWIVGILLVLTQIEFRPLDRDEGFYLYGAWRTSLGETPYQDYFYPQAPYLPYIYAPVVGLFQDGIVGGRVLSAIFMVALAVLLTVYVSNRTGSRYLGIVAGGLMLFGDLNLFWHASVKTYAVSDLLFFGGFILLMVSVRERKGNRIFIFSILSGILFAVSYHIRLVLAGSSIYLGLLILLAPGWWRFRRFLGLILGMIIASIPAFLIFIKNPYRYWFENLTFHITARLPEPWWKFAIWKATALINYLTSPDILILIILCGIGVRVLAKNHELLRDFRAEIWVGIGLMGVLFVTYLTTPTLLPQYLVQLSPFLILGAVAGVAAIFRESRGSKRTLIVLLMLLIYGGWGIGKTIGRVVEREDLNPLYGMQTVREVGQYLNQWCQVSSPDTINMKRNNYQRILTFWPAYLVAGKQNPIPGTDFGRPSFRLEWRNSPEVIHRVGLKTYDDYKQLIAEKIPSIVVLGFDTPSDFFPFLNKYYHLDKEIRGVKVFVR
jgi:hypothetical protein